MKTSGYKITIKKKKVKEPISKKRGPILTEGLEIPTGESIPVYRYDGDVDVTSMPSSARVEIAPLVLETPIRITEEVLAFATEMEERREREERRGRPSNL